MSSMDQYERDLLERFRAAARARADMAEVEMAADEDGNFLRACAKAQREREVVAARLCVARTVLADVRQALLRWELTQAHDDDPRFDAIGNALAGCEESITRAVTEALKSIGKEAPYAE